MKGMKKEWVVTRQCNSLALACSHAGRAQLPLFDCFSKRTHVHKRNTESSITRPHGSFQQIGYCDRFDLKN